MGMKDRQLGGKGGSNIPLLDEDYYNARVTSIIDYGFQIDHYKGQLKEKNEMRLHVELTEATYEAEDKDGNMEQRTYVRGRNFNLVAGDKANIMKSWLGNTEPNVYDYDNPPTVEGLKKYLGGPIRVSIAHSTKGDKTYENIEKITRVKQGVKVPAASRDLMYFSMNAFDVVLFDKFPEFVQDKIRKSPDYHALIMKKWQVEVDTTELPAAIVTDPVKEWIIENPLDAADYGYKSSAPAQETPPPTNDAPPAAENKVDSTETGSDDLPF